MSSFEKLTGCFADKMANGKALLVAAAIVTAVAVTGCSNEVADNKEAVQTVLKATALTKEKTETYFAREGVGIQKAQEIGLPLAEKMDGKKSILEIMEVNIPSNGYSADYKNAVQMALNKLMKNKSQVDKVWDALANPDNKEKMKLAYGDKEAVSVFKDLASFASLGRGEGGYSGVLLSKNMQMRDALAKTDMFMDDLKKKTEALMDATKDKRDFTQAEGMIQEGVRRDLNDMKQKAKVDSLVALEQSVIDEVQRTEGITLSPSERAQVLAEVSKNPEWAAEVKRIGDEIDAQTDQAGKELKSVLSEDRAKAEKLASTPHAERSSWGPFEYYLLYNWLSNSASPSQMSSYNNTMGFTSGSRECQSVQDTNCHRSGGGGYIASSSNSRPGYVSNAFKGSSAKPMYDIKSPSSMVSSRAARGDFKLAGKASSLTHTQGLGKMAANFSRSGGFGTRSATMAKSVAGRFASSGKAASFGGRSGGFGGSMGG